MMFVEAVEEPILMSASKQATMAVKLMDLTGTAVCKLGLHRASWLNHLKMKDEGAR